MVDEGKSYDAVADEKLYNALSPQEKLERFLQVLATDLLANKGASS